MAVSADLLEFARSYMRLDTDDESDSILTTYLEGAEGYLTRAGVEPDSCPEADYMLCVSAVALDWYDNRSIKSAQQTYEPPFGVRTMIDQLKLIASAVRSAEEDSEEESE